MQYSFKKYNTFILLYHNYLVLNSMLFFISATALFFIRIFKNELYFSKPDFVDF